MAQLPCRPGATDTPETDSLASLDANRDAFRKALVEAGFIDGGDTLRGSIEWRLDGYTQVAIVEVVITKRFPFAPPGVKIVDAGTDLELTFHVERNGFLCLWGNDMPTESWQTPNALIRKVAGWLEQTAQGWPGDEDADLERYLEQDDNHIIIYDMDKIGRDGFFRTTVDDNGVIRIKDSLSWSPSPSRMKNKGIRRREHYLAWVVDVDQVDRPIRNWLDLTNAAGHSCEQIARLIEIGSVNFVLVRYRSGTHEAVLALSTQGNFNGLPVLKSCESADASVTTRTLRAGAVATYYAKKKVAVIGCGAIGSHTADLLFRSGVRHLTLIDPERLRPGNIVRHLADNTLIGIPKSFAVKAELSALGLDTDNVHPHIGRLLDSDEALKLVRTHDLVVDATADARATALLRWATEELDRRMISVCLQRNGGIARVDRFPLWDGEHHLEPIPRLESDGSKSYEKGCGSPVSATPPLAVTKAAALGCQVALDELNMGQLLPATILEVIEPQTDSPYDQLGIITSAGLSNV